MLRCLSKAGIGSPAKATTPQNAEKAGPWSPGQDES